MPFPYAGHELSGVDQFLETHLTASASLLALLGGPFVFAELAPQSQSPPFVVFSFLSSPDRNVVGGDGRLFTRPLYLCRGVTSQTSVVQAERIAAAIDLALTGATGPVSAANLTVGPFFREEAIRYTEVVNGVEFVHCGGRYRTFAYALT